MLSCIDSLRILKVSLLTSITCILLTSCGATLPDREEQGRHLPPPPETRTTGEIPSIVDSSGLSNDGGGSDARVPVPDLYSVVAQNLPVRELLFTIARDAGINIDVHPEVAGRVSLNAVDQTLPQILDRIARQTNIRWSVDISGNLLIEHDQPYWHTYRVNYVNLQRNSSTAAEIATSISGGGQNSSSARVSQTSENNFWQTLIENLNKLAFEEEPEPVAVENADEAETTGTTEAGTDEEDSDDPKNVVVNPETGVIAIKATANKHQDIESFLNFVESRSLQQVMIEATVVEVALNDRYQAGVDWNSLSSGNLNFAQALTAGNLGNAPASVLAYDDADISATIRALSQFGNSQVLSSPRIMALNNQTAMLRVVDNRVYFTIDVEPAVVTEGIATEAVVTSVVNTVPVGFSMSVTPQVGDNDQVTLNVRPTISRIVRFVNDPNPTLAQEGLTNAIPEIQIREMESVLKVYSGQTAVLGGLMQDSLEATTDGLPTISRVPLLGNLFSYRDDTATKTELIIFIKPIVVKEPSLEADLKEYKNFLPSTGGSKLNSSRTTNSEFWGR